MKRMTLSIALPDAEPLQHTLGNTACIIGSDPLAALRVEGEGIAPRHAVIELQQDGWHIISLSDDHTLKVNGIPTDSARLKTGDEIRIGTYRITLEEQNAPSETVAQKPSPEVQLERLKRARRVRRRFTLNLTPAPEPDLPKTKHILEVRLIGWNSTILTQMQCSPDKNITIGESAEDTIMFPGHLLPEPSFTLLERNTVNVPPNATCSLIDEKGVSTDVEDISNPLPLTSSKAINITLGNFTLHLRPVAAEKLKPTPLARRFPYDTAAVWIMAYFIWGLLVYQVQLLPEPETADIIDGTTDRSVAIDMDIEDDIPEPDPVPEPVTQVAQAPSQQMIGDPGKHGKEDSIVDKGSATIEDIANATGILAAATEFINQLEQQPTIDQQLEKALASLEGPANVDPHGVNGYAMKGSGEGGGGLGLMTNGFNFGNRRPGKYTRIAFKPTLKTNRRAN